jgi:hypothetical protein
MTLLLALSLVLDPKEPPQRAYEAPPAAVEAPPAAVEAPPAAVEAPHPEMRSWGWIPAGAYGLASFGAGIAATAVAFLDRPGGSYNIPRANTALAVGAAIGLVPGLLLGQESRREENEKARGTIVLLDVVGSIALGFGYAVSHYRLTP